MVRVKKTANWANQVAAYRHDGTRTDISTGPRLRLATIGRCRSLMETLKGAPSSSGIFLPCVLLTIFRLIAGWNLAPEADDRPKVKRCFSCVHLSHWRLTILVNSAVLGNGKHAFSLLPERVAPSLCLSLR